MLEVFIISFIQGVTEFLPISSSSHLIIFSKLLNFTKSNLLFDVSVHIGSFMAVIVFFKDEILRFFLYRKIFFLILLASLPTIAAGYLIVVLGLHNKLRVIEVIGWTTIIFGILLFISDKFRNEKKLEYDLDFKSSMIIGFFQILSLIPGVSRSGITLTASRFLKFDRINAARISFLLSLPTLFAVSSYGLFEIYKTNQLNISEVNIVALLLSFVFSLITMKLFLKFLEKFNLIIFVVYRIVLGSSLLLFVYLN
tara:strand:+ start:1807 stop:2568 length:762 start_codon:yes stop_codon:yes gene_type:complete